MRRSILFIGASVILAACSTTSSTPSSQHSYRQQLDIYKGMKIRLHKIARPLLRVSPISCEKQTTDDGVVHHTLSDYPPRMRPVAANYWGLSDAKRVLFTGTKSVSNICAVPLVLEYETEAAAYSDGRSIFVTPVLLDSADDLSLSLIIAHELGHIVLDHVNQPQSQALENQADRFAVLTLARANLNYHKAVTLSTAHQQPHANTKTPSQEQKARAVRLRTYVQEVDDLKATGKPLYLNFTE